MAEGYSELFEIGLGEFYKDVEVNIVGCERPCVLLQALRLEPMLKVGHRHTLAFQPRAAV
jgi:hypothetical protein